MSIQVLIMPPYPQFLRECFPLALRGSIQGALNWALIAVAAALGGLAQYFGFQVVFAEGWGGVAAATLVTAVVAWIVIVLLRLFLVAPYELWKLNQKPEYKKKSPRRKTAAVQAG